VFFVSVPRLHGVNGLFWRVVPRGDRSGRLIGKIKAEGREAFGFFFERRCGLSHYWICPVYVLVN
jgi:hypothetical protein